MHTRHLNADGTPIHTNRLLAQTSPYLRQHAHNPVDWHPWGEAAFELARRANKPIHLSIGYAACHWCHVMAAESFEDPDTARVLNELFVNIKVDREERPDVDRIYQIAQQMLTQRSGGWPLTMFLSPGDQRPFFGGTYFPREARFGLPGFKDLAARVAAYYSQHANELREQNEALMAAFADLTPPPVAADVQLTDAPLKTARQQLGSTFDGKFGGFGRAPRFPHPRTLERLLRDWYATSSSTQPDLQALYMATLTLRRMGEGGLQDQLGGGFSRYSVDDYWMIPHFEKMLYDNGELLSAYAEAAVATGDPFYATVAARTADWAIRELQSPEGGYYSSFDADSEGHEGKFYVWDREEVRAALPDDEYAMFAARFGLDREPNFEERWHLHGFRSFGEIAQSRGITADQAQSVVQSAIGRLLPIRNRRVWPGRDEKILTSWNALMIRGMAKAARALRRDDLAASATRALEFIHGQMWRDGRLLATYKDGHAHLNAYLDDYVLLAEAILELQQTRFRCAELTFAIQLVEVVLAHFENAQTGGFYFTSDDHEALIHRSLTFSDDATPAGNGIAAFVLQRLGYLLGESRYLEAAERTLRAGWRAVEKYPHAHVTLLSALEELISPPETIVLRGDEAQINAWARDIHRLYAPHRLVLAIPAGARGLHPGLEAKTPARSEVGVTPERPATPGTLATPGKSATPVAYICQGSTCSAPIDSLGGLVARLRAGVAQPESGTTMV